MSTSLTPLSQPSTTNTFTVTQLLARVNKRRRENNDDFLDTDDGYEYINDATDELNQDDDFKSKLFSVTYAVNTETTAFYDFSTLFTTNVFERMSEVRLNATDYKGVVYRPNIDYVMEPNPSGSGQGIRFIERIQDTVQFLYYAFLPRVSASTDIIPLSPESNMYYVNKILQYIYESEDKEKRATLYEQRAEKAKMLLMNNNTYQYDSELHMSNLFL